MIRLLEGHSLTERARFQPESQPLTLNQRQSTARIVVGPAAPEISVGDWLQDMDEPGANIVWRVKSIDNQLETETRTIVLEHLINSLRDKIMFGEVKPQHMGGTASGCTALQAVTYILNQQSDWVLGNFEYGSVSNPYAFNGDDLFSGLETVSASLEGCWWSYDFTTYPFTINMTNRASVVSTELRQMRNIQTAKYTIDKSRMYTRLYPIGKNNLHIDGNFVSRNANLYGIIEKTETDQSKATKAELQRWAEERIANHCEPSVTWTVQALDFSRETGESLDHIVLGAMCRMPLPGYDTVIEEIITQLNYPDKIRDREMCTVTLANIQEDVASIINSQNAKSGGGGRAAAKNAEEDHAWMEDEKDHIALIAEGIAGEGAAEDWSRIAELLVDGDGIHQRVQQVKADVVNAYSLIDQTTTAIRIEIGTVASEVRSFIETTPDMIHMEVGYAVSGFAQSVIEQTATYIRTEVQNAASAITGTVVEQTVEYVRTEVASVASGVAWSVIEQTMTNIEQQIARKSKVYIQWEDPNNGTNVLYEGDIWIRRNNNKTWNAANAAGEKWNQSGVAWRRKYGDIQYVWKNGAWVLVKDFAVDVENEVKLEQTADGLALLGHAVDTENNRFNSSLEVTARQIRSEVNTANSQVYSVIQQTATNIRAEVGNAVNGLYSVIEQTSTYIYTTVENTKSDLRSLIQQEANRISLVVEGTGANAHIKPAEIVASINNGSSQIRLSADHIDIDGLISKLSAKDVMIANLNATDGEFIGNMRVLGESGIRSYGPVEGTKGDFDTLHIGEYDASWKSLSFIRVTNVSPSRRWLYAGSSGTTPSGALLSNVITTYDNRTIYYLGR